MMPKVDTFEHNIADEIKRKEASLTQISSASNNVGNDPIDLPKKPPVFFYALLTFFILCLIGLGVLGYLFISGQATGGISAETPPVVATPTLSDITTVSPTLSENIGRFVTRVDKKEQGYVITINSYSPVFAYMTRNETAYIEELASLFTDKVTTTTTATSTLATTTEKIVVTTPQIPDIKATTSNATVATTTATSTLATTTPKASTSKTIKATSTKPANKTAVGTTTPATTTIPVPQEQPLIVPEISAPLPVARFSDITLSNQNMRVWTSDKTTVVYAFVGNTTVLISNSKEGVLALKGAILK